MKFDDANVGQDRRQINMDLHVSVKDRNGVPIMRETMTFERGKYVTTKTCSVTQFPLNLYFASTSHKMQGKTLKDQDIVCYTHEKLPAGCGYVMLSRATNIKDANKVQ